ncbi:MAG: hypothetical protein WCT52_05130 [Candidatus Micrarchaeia archaeon]
MGNLISVKSSATGEETLNKINSALNYKLAPYMEDRNQLSAQLKQNVIKPLKEAAGELSKIKNRTPNQEAIRKEAILTYVGLEAIANELDKIEKPDSKAGKQKLKDLSYTVRKNIALGKTALQMLQSAPQTQTAPEKQGFTVNAKAESMEFERLLVSTMQRITLSQQLLYGVTKDERSPALAKDLLISDKGGNVELVKKLIEQDSELSSKPKLKAILLGWDEMVQGKMVHIDGAVESKDNLTDVFQQLTFTQKAIDGISLMMKGKYGGVSVSSADLEQFFGNLLVEDDEQNIHEMKAVLDFANGKSNNGAAVVDMIFSRLQSQGKISQELCGAVSSLVIDSNFGENAAGLQVLIENMGGAYSNGQGKSVENLKAFYECLAGTKGLGSTENTRAFDMLGSTITNRLLNETTYIGDQTSGTRRDKFDISLLYAFAYASKSKDGYVSSPIFKSQSSQFLDIVSGGGSLPSAVPLTIVQNRETLDFMYDNFRQNESGFFDIMSALTNRVTSIYSRPLESRFNPAAGVSTRFEAADMLVRKIAELRGNALLDDMVSRFVDTTYAEDRNMIKLKNPFSMVLLGGQQEDWNNIRNFLKSMNIKPAEYSQLEEQYRNIQQFARNNTPGVDFARAQEMKFNLLRKLPQTYLYGMDEIYGNIVATREYFKPSQVTGAGNANYTRETTDVEDGSGKIEEGLLRKETSKGTGSLGVSGPVGSILTKYDAYTVRDINDVRTGTGNETIFTRSSTEARNIYLGQTEINEAFLNWAEQKNSQLQLEGVTLTNGYSNDLNFKLRGISYGAGLLLMGERRFDDKGNSKLYIEAVINDGDRYLRVVNLDKFVNDAGYKDIEKKVEAHMKYVETCQWALPIGTYAAYENQNRNVPVGYLGGNYALNPDGSTQTIPGTRNGFIIGAGNVLGDHRLAGLTVKTVDGSELHLGEYGNFKSATNSSALVVTGGYMLLRDPTDLFGRDAKYNYNSQGRINTTVAGSEFMSNKPTYLFSAMTDKFYGLAVGNKEVAGGQMGTSMLGGNLSVGGIIRYEGGPRAYMYNGQYFGSGFSATAYTEGGQDRPNTSSGVVNIKMGDGWALNLYGLSSTNKDIRSGTGLNNIQSNPQAKMLLNGISSLSDKIAAVVDNKESAWKTIPLEQRNQLLREWTTELVGYLDQASQFLPSEAVESLRSQFSIGIEKPGDAEIKLSIVKLGGQDAKSEEGTYLVTMDRIRAGKSIISFTAGVPIPAKDKYIGENMVRNFAGVHLNVGNLTFGATGYNFGSSEPTGMKFNVVHVDDEFAKGFSVSLFGKGAHRETLFLGNRIFKVSLGNTNAKGLTSKEIAASYMLAARYNIGAYFRTTGQQVSGEEALRLKEAGLTFNYTSLEGHSVGGEFFINHGKGGKSGDVMVKNTDIGMRFNFRLAF